MQIIQKENGGFECIYPEGSIVASSISDKTNSMLSFELVSCEKRFFPFPKWFDSTYNSQFGITVTKDGKRFFAQNWEKGLFCYSLETGKLLWHFKRKHATLIILDDEKLVCFFADWGAAGIAICDGELLKRYPLSTDMSDYFIVDESHMMLGPKYGAFSIIDMDLNEQYRIPLTVMNPGNYYSCLIQKADMKNGILTISGIEQTEDEMSRWAENKDKNRFVRSIPLDKFRCSTQSR